MDFTQFGISNETIGAFLAWFIGLQAIFFGIGKGLTEIAKHTETKYDNMVANAFSKAAWFMGSIISKFGWSMPSEVVKEKAKKLEEKEK